MFDYLDKYAKEKGSELALIEYDTGEEVTWKDFATKSKAFAAKLLSIGLKKGDIVATSLPLLKEHIFLMYACYRLGIIIAPLDLRLKTEEINRNFEKMKPRVKAYFFLGKTPTVDFRPLIEEVMKNHRDTCKYWVQFQKEEDLIMDGAIGISEFVKGIKGNYIKSLIFGSVKNSQKKVQKKIPPIQRCSYRRNKL